MSDIKDSGDSNHLPFMQEELEKIHERAAIEKLVEERREKLKAIRAQGIAFPNDFRPQNKAAALHAKYGELNNEALEAAALKVSVAGRMMLKRVMGKASFATL